MTGYESLQEIAAKCGDLSIPRKLSSEAYDTVTYTASMLTRLERHLEILQNGLQARGVVFDAEPFNRLRNDCDAAWYALQPVLMAHINAPAEAK